MRDQHVNHSHKHDYHDNYEGSKLVQLSSGRAQKRGPQPLTANIWVCCYY